MHSPRSQNNNCILWLWTQHALKHDSMAPSCHTAQSSCRTQQWSLGHRWQREAIKTWVKLHILPGVAWPPTDKIGWRHDGLLCWWSSRDAERKRNTRWWLHTQTGRGCVGAFGSGGDTWAETFPRFSQISFAACSKNAFWLDGNEWKSVKVWHLKHRKVG